MTPLFTAGPLYVTPYSLMILLGAITGVGLSLRKKQIRPLLPAVLLGALVFGHLVWVLFCPFDLEAPEGKLYMLLRPWEGGYTIYGALLGGRTAPEVFRAAVAAGIETDIRDTVYNHLMIRQYARILAIALLCGLIGYIIGSFL